MKLGVIGYGNRIRKVIREITAIDPTCYVAGINDIRNTDIRHSMDEETRKQVMFFDSPEELAEKGGMDGLLIGTLDDTHAEMVCRVIDCGLPIFVEKPVATTLEDVYRLKAAYETSGNQKVCVSFPNRVSPLMEMVKEIVDSGKIGTVEHVQAWDNCHYGGNFFHNRIRDAKITGGLFLQKATHDFDYINYIVGLKPVSLCAMTSRQVFGGNKPADLRCGVCDENETCEESKASTNPQAHCCFSEDIENEDSGTAIWKYESGMHATFTQNYVVRKAAGTRGARFIGYKGTIEIEFASEDSIKVFMHHTSRVETYQFPQETAGKKPKTGDPVLAKNFIQVMKGQEDPLAPLEAGLLSSLMAVKAHMSAKTDRFESLIWDEG